jgi:putative flippase GtrA
MEERTVPVGRRRRLLAKFSGVALIGLAVSAVVLHLALEAGLRPWAARLVALLCAMNVTFLINGRFVFGALTRERFLSQWVAYLANSAFGNVCNFWVFVTLDSTHRPVIGNPYVALVAGSITAWAINFTGARFLVFGAAGRRLAGRLGRLWARAKSDQTEPADREDLAPESDVCTLPDRPTGSHLGGKR